MWFDLASGWRKYNASLAVWGLRSWPLFGVESQPLLGVFKRIAGIGKDSVPSSLAVVESLTASRSPVVGRFDCSSKNEFDSLAGTGQGARGCSPPAD